MPYKDIDRENINQEAANKASDAVYEKSGERVRRPDTDELWELWYKVYEREGGKTIVIEEKGESTTAMLIKCNAVRRPLPTPPQAQQPQPKPPEPKKEPKKEPEKPKEIPPLTLKIVELEFLSDHHVMKNNDTDWKNTGALYEKPDWTPAKSNPISHSMKKKATVRVVINAEGEAPDDAIITCTLRGGDFFDSGKVRLKVGDNTLVLTSLEDLAPKMTYGKPTFEWFAKTRRKPEICSIGNTQNYIMITFGDPICRASTDPEVGITAKRMLTSLKRIIATGKTERHETVQALMGQFTFYQLRNNPVVPADLKHPTYENPEIGAWALDDYREHSAECQAICRYVTAMLEQVGLPGAQVVVVWADPLDMKAKEAAYGEGGLRRVSRTVEESYEIEEDVVVPIELGFFDKFSGKPTERIERRKKTATKKITQYAYLTTSKPTVGQNAEPCGLNLYEACLKFTDENSVVRYYGGGTGDHFFNTRLEVVGAFHSLIWISNEKNPAYTPPSYEEKLSGKINLHAAPPTLRFCREIVHSWRK